MPPKVKITKESILDASLDMIIKKGYPAVNIKSVAQALGCSTQPVSWQFGNMENFREELLNAAVGYANKKMTSNDADPLKTLWHIGIAYIDLAVNEPNLFRFVYMGESGIYHRGGFSSMTADKGNADLIERLCSDLSVDKDKIETFVQRLIIYTHGIASLLTAGVIHADKMTAVRMLHQFASEQLERIGANIDTSYLLEEAI
jgi:AcrR family transcriptional regulator